MINDTHATLGSNGTRGPIVLSPAARSRHLYVIGQTGTGKSTLLLNLIGQDLAAGRGVALIDPHGSLAADALGLIPATRAHELVYIGFEAADRARPIGFNVLEQVPPDMRPVVADGVVAAFHHAWPDSWGPRLEHVLTHALRALLDAPDTTLLGISRLLTDAGYRARILATVADPIVAQFWRGQYEAWPDAFREQAIEPIVNKIDKVIANPALRNIVAQPRSTIDLRRMMDEGRILIVNLAKGVLGEGASQLFGAMLTTAIATAALSRADIAEDCRRPFHFYADEFHNYATNGFAVILSEARKYGLCLTLAHQYMAQLDTHEQLRAAVLGNAGSLVAFRLGADDATLIARQIQLGYPDPAPSALQDLANFKAFTQVLIDGLPSGAIHIVTPPPPAPVNHRVHRLLTNSRVRFGRDRAMVEDKISRFLAP